MKSIKLPSGAELRITPAPFKDARALVKAISDEGLMIKLKSKDEVENAIKDAFCVAVSSDKIQAALEKCLERCLYNGKKITEDLFEPVEARADYYRVCFEVAKENVLPFARDLYAAFSPLLESVQKSPA